VPFIIQWFDSCLGVEEIIKIPTPVGNLVVHSHQGVISEVDWALEDSFSELVEHELQQQMAHYWLNATEAIHIKLLKQGSDYRNRVWNELCQIPLGETMTYSALANKMGSSARAVGNACRDNPYPLFIPCHRVVSVSGMGGYCGQTQGELMAIKIKLLEFEAAQTHERKLVD
jgi:methylated-DNA-[protein]-cysteine S-methyltransferase